MKIRESIKNETQYLPKRETMEEPYRVLLDANENPYRRPGALNRYPSSGGATLKDAIGKELGVSPRSLVLGNGSDECIDILLKAVCEPGVGRVVVLPPTFTMYEKISRTLGLKVIQVPRLENFAVDIEKLLPQAVQSDVVFLCNPNNPTGTVTPIDDVELIANNLPSALIVVDEAYAEFSPECSVIPLVKRCRNVTVLRTFSKAYGLAGLRIGCLIGNEELVGACETVRLPYNISTLTERLLLRALRDPSRVRSEVAEIRKEREKMKVALRKLPIVKEVTPSGGNFLFAKIRSVKMLEQTLTRERILLREISRDTNGEGNIRISIGTPEENKELVRTLKQL